MARKSHISNSYTIGTEISFMLVGRIISICYSSVQMFTLRHHNFFTALAIVRLTYPLCASDWASLNCYHLMM